eukprot:COSAG01_NODE_1392_length_10483_cov_26.368163_7_plen_120_part_00
MDQLGGISESSDPGPLDPVLYARTHRTGLRTNTTVQRGSNQALFHFPCRGLIQEEARSATIKNAQIENVSKIGLKGYFDDEGNAAAAYQAAVRAAAAAAAAAAAGCCCLLCVRCCLFGC